MTRTLKTLSSSRSSEIHEKPKRKRPIPQSASVDLPPQSIPQKSLSMSAATQYLPLENAELELLDCKLAVVTAIRDEQRKRKLTTQRLAVRLGLSRARTESLLQCDSGLTLDEIACAYFRLDMQRRDFGDAVQRDVAMAWGVDGPSVKSSSRKTVRRAMAWSTAPAREEIRRAA